MLCFMRVLLCQDPKRVLSGYIGFYEGCIELRTGWGLSLQGPIRKLDCELMMVYSSLADFSL